MGGTRKAPSAPNPKAIGRMTDPKGLRFVEVKGRVAGADTITVTKNEILTSLNKPDDFILAIVAFEGEGHSVHNIRRPFQAEPDFGAASVNYEMKKLLAAATEPC